MHVRDLCRCCSLPSLDYFSRPVATVLTLYCDVLVALQQGFESTGDASVMELQSCRVAYIEVTYCVPHVKMKAIVRCDVEIWSFDYVS